MESVGDSQLISRLPRQRQTLSTQGCSSRVVALVVGKHASARERPRARGDMDRSTRAVWLIRCDAIREPQCLVEPATPLGEVAAGIPELPDGGAETQCCVRIVFVHSPVQCRAQVVVLCLESLQPLWCVDTRQLRLCQLGE